MVRVRGTQPAKRAGLLNSARTLVRTRSSGLHIYFAGTAQPCGRLPVITWISRAGAAMSLAPPTVVGGSPYELLDHRPGRCRRLDWATVRRLLDPREAARAPSGDAGTSVPWSTGSASSARGTGTPAFLGRLPPLESGHDDQLAALAEAASVPACPRPRHGAPSNQPPRRR